MSARVLIVDASAESRSVLRALLERSGTETLEAAGARRAMELLKDESPDLIVFDEDCAEHRLSDAAGELARTAAGSSIPIVVLGTVRRRISPLPTGELVAKPYHYAALIRRIEGLLGDRSVEG